MDAHLIRLLEDGATLVTPNRRLARDLTRRFDLAQADAGRAAWRSADILPWEAWLGRCLRACAREDAALLVPDALQETALWRRTIEGAAQAPLLDVGAAARSARDAQTLRHAWRIDCSGPHSEDVAAWLDWSRRFEAACRRQGWTESARRLDLIAGHVRAGGVGNCEVLVLYAFDQLAPQERDVLDACRARGIEVIERAPARNEAWVHCVECLDEEHERRHVAEAVRALLSVRPQARVGIVVPNLAASREAWIRVLDDALQPSRWLPGGSATPRPYNLSLGRPLSVQPMVHAALALLRLAQGTLPLGELGVLLRGPFLGGAETERMARARLDARLRRFGRPDMSLDTLLREVRRSDPAGASACRLLAARLQEWLPRSVAARGRRQLPSSWSMTFLELCTALGWPGERPLDSEEYQTQRKWQETVSSLARLDAVLGRVGYGEALAWLARTASDIAYQPESPDVPVQVLGTLESVGLEFDALFVTGLHDEAFPESPHPNPFLPVARQRSAGVPHASAEWELAFAQRMLAHWSGAAAQVQLSYPARQGDRVLRPSALLTGFESAPAHAWDGGLAERMRNAARLEIVPDGRGAAREPGMEVPGGVAVLEDQAACPFRAFVIHRLGARALSEPQPGLAPRERGTLVHRAVALLWEDLQSQARLLALDATQREAAVGRAVDAALDALRGERPDALTPAFAELERARLCELLTQLLEQEAVRAPFRVVEREAPRDIDFAGLRLRARVDRVDELEDDRRVVIDYKTGAANVSHWIGERPDAPQVPLYALTDGGEVAAVAFAMLRAGDVGFTGLATQSALLPGVGMVQPDKTGAADFAALLREWRRQLEALAQGFLAGEATVAPKRYPKTCEYCDVRPVCRVGELYDRGPVSEEDNGDER